MPSVRRPLLILVAALAASSARADDTAEPKPLVDRWLDAQNRGGWR